MPSGAGHDAQDMAVITPTGMIFIPSIDGISHSPEEYSTPESIIKGANVLNFDCCFHMWDLFLMKHMGPFA